MSGRDGLGFMGMDGSSACLLGAGAMFRLEHTPRRAECTAHSINPINEYTFRRTL